MKYLLLVALRGGLISRTAAQTPIPASNQSQQFCRVAFVLGMGGRLVGPTMYYGQESKVSPVTDSELAEEAVRVHSFDSQPFLFAYLYSQGWQLTTLYDHNSVECIFQLRKP